MFTLIFLHCSKCYINKGYLLANKIVFMTLAQTIEFDLTGSNNFLWLFSLFSGQEIQANENYSKTANIAYRWKIFYVVEGLLSTYWGSLTGVKPFPRKLTYCYTTA